MSEQQLREMFKDAAELAARIFADRGEVPAHWIGVTADEEYFILPPPIGVDDPDVAIKLVRALFKERGVVCYVVMVESWVVESISDAEMDAAQKKGLEHHPNRVEIIALSGEDAESGLALLARIPIIRDPHPHLGPCTEPGVHYELSGSWVGMLPVKGVRQ